MKVKELLKGLSYDCVQGSEEIEVTEIVNDSRKVVPGCLFMCIAGANFDGQSRDYHYAYYGEIVGAYVIDAE